MKSLLQAALKKVIEELYSITDVTPSIDFTNDLKFGDFTTNIAMVITKTVKKAPNVIALEISQKLSNEALQDAIPAKIQTITPIGGFINFTLSTNLLWDLIIGINRNYGTTTVKQVERIMVEYGQPNTHKLPHIGHLFSYIVGDSLARIKETQGHSVMRANYQGDVGPHVAKAIYGFIQIGQIDPKSPEERVRLLQKCYQEGSKAYEEDPIAKETIDDINKKIYTEDPEIIQIWKETRQWSVDYYAMFEQKLGVQQTFHYFEKDTFKTGKQIVEENIGKIFEKSEGAIIFPGKKFGYHDRVFLTKNNTPTYEAKDVGLNIQKFQDWEYDQNIITTASEQNAYFDVVIKAIEQVAPHLEGKVKHIGFGMISLSTGKMSSRTGQILSAIDLIDAVQGRVEEIMKSREGLSEQEREAIIEKVAMAAIKFAFLKQNILQNMKFDIEESVSFEGRSGPYLQYTYARINSILRQNTSTTSATATDEQFLQTEAEISLMRWIYRFPHMVSEASTQNAPHLVAEYTYQLAQYFNTFYTSCPINTAKDEETKRARKTLAEKTAQVIKNGLELLGIETVEKM